MDKKTELMPKLYDWLNKQGYPLEMRVASKIRGLTDLDIRQGWHYQDPESGSSREIDIVCTALEPRGIAEINFVFECKATNKPWILFSSDDAATSYNRLHSFGIFSNTALAAVSDNLLDIKNGSDFKEAKSIPWLWKEGLVGYSIAQAFEGNKDVPYKATLSAVKAAIWLSNNSLWQNKVCLSHSISFPIVVTNSPLFECFLNGDGNPELKQIDYGYLFFKKNLNDFTATCVSVVNEKHLDGFIQECNEVSTRMFEAMKSSMEDDWNDFIKKS